MGHFTPIPLQTLFYVYLRPVSVFFMPGTPTKSSPGARQAIRAQVLAYHVEGKGGREIGRLLDLNKSTVRSIVRRWKGDSPGKARGRFADAPRTGRPSDWSKRCASDLFHCCCTLPNSVATSVKLSGLGRSTSSGVQGR